MNCIHLSEQFNVVLIYSHKRMICMDISVSLFTCYIRVKYVVISFEDLSLLDKEFMMFWSVHKIFIIVVVKAQ